MNVRDVLSSPASMRLALAFLHFLWQGLVIAVLAAVGARVLGGRSARARYGVHVAALFAMVLAVAVTYAVLQPTEGPRAPLGVESAASSSEAAPDALTAGEPVALASLEAAATGASQEDGPARAAALIGWPHAAPIAVGVYFLGVLVMIGRLLVGLQGGGRLRRQSQPVDDAAILAALGRQARALGLAFTPALAYCSRVLVPTVVGVLRPIILLPFSFASGLAVEQVEALLAHELAHIRRLDPLVNVVQRVIEAVLFFHPAVWFVSQRIRVEREHCCDDLVVGVSASASTYASSLVEAARRGLQGRAMARLAPQGVGLADRPSRLRARIARLLGRQVHERMRLRWTWLMGLTLAAGVGLLATVSFGGGTDEDQNTAAGGATGGGAADSGDTTAPKEAAPAGGADAILKMLTSRADADVMLQVDLDLLLARIDRAVLDDVLEKVAPGSGDPSERPLVLSAEQREALDAALAELPEEAFQRRSAPRLRTGNRARASIRVVGKRGNEGDAEDAVGLSCAPVVSADRESIVLVLFSTTAKGKPAGSLHFGSDAVQLPNTDDGGLMAAYRIANGGTLVLTGTPVHAPTSTAGMTPGPKAGAQPYVQLALVRARTVDDVAAAEEVSEARQRIIEKLNTRIPQLDFKDADLEEVVNYVCGEVDLNVVIDPAALARLKEAGGKVTLSLKGVPFGEALTFLLKQKGLKYTVEDNAIVIVPIDRGSGDESAGETPLTAENLDEFETRTFRLLPGADRTVPDGDLTQVEDMLLHGGAVKWPEGSSIVYDEPTRTLTVTNTRLNLVAIREMIRVWNALEGHSGEGGHARASSEAVSSAERTVGETVSTEVRSALGGDAVADSGADEAAEARQRIEKKLDAVIADVSFLDADLKELLDFLAKTAGVNIVIDPKAAKQLEDAGGPATITIKLKNVPLRFILKTVLAQKDLMYVVKDDAVVVVPIEKAPPKDLRTEIFRLSVSGTRTVVPPGGERREETIDEWLRRAEGVTWPEGSTIAYDKRTETLVVTNAPQNMAAIYKKIRAWNRGIAQTDPPGSRVIIRTASVGSEPVEDAAGEKMTTGRFNLQVSGTRTVLDAGGESRTETIDEWLRGAEDATWPAGSRIVYDPRIEMLTVSNTAENLAVIRELVRTWEAAAADAASEDSAERVDEKEAD